MKMFLSALSSDSGQTPTPPLNEFSQVVTVCPIVENEHRGFTSMIMIGNTVHVFYRYGASHVSMDGVLMTQSSSDDGETWSGAVEIFNPDPLVYDEFPDIIQDDPDNLLDWRDVDCTIIGNNLVIVGNVTVATFTPPSTRTVYTHISVRMLVPIVNGVPYYNNKSIYMDDFDSTFTYGCFYDEFTDTLFYTTYASIVTGTFEVRLYKSNDGGVTATYVSDIFPTAGAACNESYIWRDGDILRAYGRDRSGGNGYLNSSNDNGNTWGTPVQTNYRYQGQKALSITDSNAAIVGRLGSKSSLYTLDGTTINQSPFDTFTGLEGGGDGQETDRGYQGLLEHRGKYFVCTFQGILNGITYYTADTGIFFRQLNYDSVTNTFTYGND